MAANERATLGLQSARTKLDGLLKDLVDKTEESSEDDVLKAPIESIITVTMPPPTTPTKRGASGKTPRKRRKKEASSDGASYVMKLFDRSVDFAKYNEETPLYVLARSWMQNKPHTTKTADSHASTSQEKEAPGQEGLQPADGEEGDGEKFITSFPEPVKCQGGEDRLDVPKPLPKESLALNIHEDPSKAPPVAELKRHHIERWKKVKTRWRDASFANQTRYFKSIQMLRELFDNQ